MSAESKSDLYFNISSRNLKLLMEINSSLETNKFFSELSRSMDR